MHLLLHANATNNLQIFKLCKPLLISLPTFIKFQSQEKRMAKLWSPAAFRVLLTICCVPQIMLHSHVSAEEYYIRQPPRSVIQTPHKRSESDPQQVNTYNKKETIHAHYNCFFNFHFVQQLFTSLFRSIFHWRGKIILEFLG